MSKKDIIEDICGHPVTQTASTVLSTMAAPYALLLTPLLPVLIQSLASERQKVRVNQELESLNQKLEALGDTARTLSDEQYKFINETVITILQTTNSNKLQYLRNAVERAAQNPKMTHSESVILARIIRDISASELLFLINYFKYSALICPALGEYEQAVEDCKQNKGWGIVENIPDVRINLTGLLTLGLLVKFTIIGEGYEFSPMVVKILALVAPAEILSDVISRSKQ